MKTSTHFRIIGAASAVAILTSLGAGAVHAQASAADAALTEFPADALTLNSKEVDQRLRGQVYTGTSVMGDTFRIEYKDSGYVFINLSNGRKDSGTWRAEEGKVCVEYRGRMHSGCSELRATSDKVYGKRDGAAAITMMQKQ